jgi:hypothetical protein
MILGDTEAVVLRVESREGKAVVLGELPDRRDMGQIVTPLRVDLGDGCEAAPGRALSAEELPILVGLRDADPSTIDLLLVPALVSGGRSYLFKSYPAGTVRESVHNSILLGLPVLDESGRWPFALARAVGELLLPAVPSAPGPHSLFSDPMAEVDDLLAAKRIWTPECRIMRERLLREKDLVRLVKAQ